MQYPLAADRGTPLRLLIALALTAVSVLVSYYLIKMPALRLKERLAPRRRPGRAPASVKGSAGKHARRDILPLFGMGTMMLVALSAYGLGTRFPAQLEVASVAAPPAPPEPPATSHPRRNRQASRKRRHAKRQSKTKSDAADAPRRSRGHATPKAGS